MKRPSRLDYAYAVGRVRALEDGLVSRPAFREAAEERDIAGALKVIFDAGQFFEEPIEIDGSGQLDGFLEREEHGLYKLLSELLLEEEILQILVGKDSLENKLQLSQRLNYSFITDYIRHWIDLGNIKLFFRIKYLGLPVQRLSSLLMKEGFLDQSFMIEGFDLSFTELGEKIYASPYQRVWTNATDSLEEKETFVALERGFEDFLMLYLRKAKYIVFGPEPIFAYALGKKRELQLVRLLGLGKINHIPPEILKERISETYV
jgi:vacuolar-type H+-ATPase subunit C/Vma6